MYSVLLSEYEKGMELVESKLKKMINPTQKAVIIAWAFPTEIDKKTFDEEWFPKGGRRYNKYVGSLLKLAVNVYVPFPLSTNVPAFADTDVKTIPFVGTMFDIVQLSLNVILLNP